MLENTGRIVTVHKREALVAACEDSFRSGMLEAIQSKELVKEDWVLWASTAALGAKRDEVHCEDGGHWDIAAARSGQTR